VFSPVQAVLDNDMGAMMRRFIRKPSLEKEALNWDELMQIRAGGHFLDSAHTIATCRDQLVPKVFKRQGRDDYEKSGRRTAFDEAREAPGKAGWSNKTIAACAQWSEREIAALKPPVVVLCGSLATRHYLPDLRFGETGGRVVWDAKRGVNFVVGVNPAAIHFDEAKRPVL